MDKFFDLALEQAMKSPMHSKYGAVLVSDNKVMSKGFNTYKTFKNNNHQCILCG